MKRTTLHRATGVAALALTMSFGLAACGNDDSSTQASGKSMSDTKSSSGSATDAGGPGPRRAAEALRAG